MKNDGETGPSSKQLSDADLPGSTSDQLSNADLESATGGTGSHAGKVTLSDFHFVKKIDKSSSTLG
jgi:type VI protein secretion system component Hcp